MTPTMMMLWFGLFPIVKAPENWAFSLLAAPTRRNFPGHVTPGGSDKDAVPKADMWVQLWVPH
jgi:hypothetical protein